MSVITKYNQYFASDIFNLKTATKVKPTLIRNKTLNNLDHINTLHSTDLKDTLPKRKIDYQHSDIFFINEPKNKVVSNIRNNINKSTVFSDCVSKDYKVKRENVKSDYTPEKYLKFDESNISRHNKEFYNNKCVSRDPDFKGNSTKGFLNHSEVVRNNIHPNKVDISRNKKKCEWNYVNSSNVKYMTNDNNLNKAKFNRINELQSNIFNDSNKKQYTYNDLNIKQSSPKSNQPEPKKYKTLRSKWPETKYNWLNVPSELIFKKFDDNKTEKVTAYTRKENELTESINIYNNDKEKGFIKKEDLKKNVNDNTSDIKTIKDIIRSASPNIKQDKIRKYMDQISSVGFDKDFYKRNINTKDKDIQTKYQIVNTNNNTNFYFDDVSLKKMLSKEGIHVYDIKTINDGINRDTKIEFKIRNNNNNIANTIKKFENENGVSIQKVNKITVNKRKTDAGSGKCIWDGKQRENSNTISNCSNRRSHINNNNNNNNNININKNNSSNNNNNSNTIKVKRLQKKQLHRNKSAGIFNRNSKSPNNQGFLKNRFSNQFVKVDINYKNNMGFIPLKRNYSSIKMYL